MNNLSSPATRRHPSARLRQPHTWIMSCSNMVRSDRSSAFSFASAGPPGPVQVGVRTPIDAAYLTFLGPLDRPANPAGGGSLADRFGGARVTFLTFIGMAMGAVACWPLASAFVGPFLFGFTVLFALSGIGNGSTYKISRPSSGLEHTRGRSRRRDHDAEAVGAGLLVRCLGLAARSVLRGVLVNVAFRESFLSYHSRRQARIGVHHFLRDLRRDHLAVYLRRVHRLAVCRTYAQEQR